MAKQQAVSRNKVNLQALSPNIREFLSVSARYLGCQMNSPQIDDVSCLADVKLGVKQKDQEVGYATNHV